MVERPDIDSEGVALAMMRRDVAAGAAFWLFVAAVMVLLAGQARAADGDARRRRARSGYRVERLGGAFGETPV